MRLIVKKTSLRPVLQWSQRILFSGSVLMLGYCGYVLADTWIFEHHEKTVQATGAPMKFMHADGVLGRIEVARLGISAMVVEGTDETTLRRAAGHISGTAMPGHPGNVGIAAHRDSFFRPLRNIRRNDTITLTTDDGEYLYRVVSTKIVKPSDVAVLKGDGKEILTLVTCYPFYFIGSAPERFIVRARRVSGELSGGSE
jgi:sortase A